MDDLLEVKEMEQLQRVITMNGVSEAQITAEDVRPTPSRPFLAQSC